MKVNASALYRVRFGITLPFFKNAGVFVFYTTAANVKKMQDAVEMLKAALMLAGQDAIAGKIVFDYKSE